MIPMIPVSVIVMTKNEAANIVRCLDALHDFAEVVVVDSGSTDGTQTIAKEHGARVIDFKWNGQYPKKKQWSMEHESIKHDWVFHVDADEVVTPALVEEIRRCRLSGAGYFVKGQYVIDGKLMKHGLRNSKLCLVDRRKMEFPVIDDLDMPGMGEVEGHYQPVLKAGCLNDSIAFFKESLLHYSYDEGWEERHKRYALWEKEMNRRNAWPQDPVHWRQTLKQVFRNMPMRGLIAFLHCYVWKLGALDGRSGFWFAASRYRYYRMIG